MSLGAVDSITCFLVVGTFELLADNFFFFFTIFFRLIVMYKFGWQNIFYTNYFINIESCKTIWKSKYSFFIKTTASLYFVNNYYIIRYILVNCSRQRRSVTMAKTKNTKLKKKYSYCSRTRVSIKHDISDSNTFPW